MLIENFFLIVSGFAFPLITTLIWVIDIFFFTYNYVHKQLFPKECYILNEVVQNPTFKGSLYLLASDMIFKFGTMEQKNFESFEKIGPSQRPCV